MPSDGNPAGREEDGAPILLRWPADRTVVEQLARRGVPRLLLVDADCDPPVSVDPLEDWLRMPAPDRDVKANAAALQRRAEEWAARPAPVLDGSGRLLRAGQWVTLSPMEEQLMEVLSENFGGVVGDGTLLARGWPDGGGTHTALRVQLVRLRRRISALGLEIKTVRGRGYVLQAARDTPAARGSDATVMS